MAWIYFSETNLPHCFTLKTNCGIFIQKPKILQVPYMLPSNTFFPSNPSSRGIGLGQCTASLLYLVFLQLVVRS